MNPNTENPYIGPMRPYPGLERWSKQVQLLHGEISLHLYDTAADGLTPILFLHGLGDEADTWRHVLPLLSAGYRCLAPDLPGFGGSDKPDARYTIPFFAKTILDLMDTCAIARPVIVGHSAGAMIAQHLAAAHPERVEKLVLISGPLLSTGRHIDLGTLMFLTPGLGEWAYNRLRKDPQAAFRTLKPYYSRLEDLTKTDQEFLFQRVNERVWSDGQRKGFLSTFRNLGPWLANQQSALSNCFKEWTIPTAVIWGEEDRINPVINARGLAQMIPSARLDIIPDAGHNVQQEKGPVVAGIIDDLASRR
jgi:pimeloyl-ACP methyl ester carboxylesterase